MKLALKMTVALAIGILAVMAVNRSIRFQRELALFEAERAADQHLVGRVLRASVEAVSSIEGQKRAMELVQQTNDGVSDAQIRWVWLDDGEDAEHRPSMPLEDLRTRWNGRDIVRMETEDRQFAFVPLATEGARPAAVELSESLDRQHDYLRASVRQTAAATVGIALVCGLIAMGIGVWFVGRPIRHLCEQTRRVGAGDLSGRLAITQRDEIGELAREINHMCDRLAGANELAARETEARIAALDQLRHADRLKTVGQLASGVAHELGTPLNVISGRAKMVMQGAVSGDELAKSTQVIAEQADRMTAIIRQLLDFARQRGPRLGICDLNAVTQKTIDLLAPLAQRRQVSLAFDPASDPVLAELDPNQIQQVLTNVTMNGIQATPVGGRVRLGIERGAAVPPDGAGLAAETGVFVRVTVEDEGSGMPPEVVEHVFEPFFTTKGVGHGTGLGLSVAYGIVREHRGWIEVESAPGRGSRFAIYLRAAAADEERVGE
jgi:signal transduction histidine kinase